MRLFPFERRWFAIVFETILPAGASDKVPLGARDVPLLRFVDDLFASAPFRMLAGFRVALWVVFLAPLWLLGRPRLFGALSPGDRIDLLHRLRRNRVYMIRELPTLLKTVACLGYCGLPSVQAAIGYDRIDPTPPAWAREDRT